ncbi:hypothetical protein EJB05_46930, partial [Eragrostis curvula]
MANQHLLLVVLMACILHAATSATVYDVLAQNNLPRGLLPLGVKSYVLHADGALEVPFPGECNFFVTIAGKQYKFRYGSTVGGIIKPGSINTVYGVRMQVEFAWLGFNKVERAGDKLKITVETTTQQFPVSAFAQSPRCI